MATFITLVNFTQKGVENIKEGPKRLDAAKQLAQSMGGELKAFYLTMGRYDAVVIGEAPSAEAVMKVNIANAMRGNVRTETLTAFTEEEYRKIISELP